MRKLLNKYFVYLRYFPAELPCYSVPTTFSALHSGKAETFNFCTGLGMLGVLQMLNSRSIFLLFQLALNNGNKLNISSFLCIEEANLGRVSYMT